MIDDELNELAEIKSNLKNSLYTKGISVGDSTPFMVYPNGVEDIDISIDADLSDTSENAVQNKTVKAALDQKLGRDATTVEVICIIEAYANGTSWYRIYSDGWCEQGGVCPDTGSGGLRSSSQVTLFKEYEDITYNIQITSMNNYQYDAGSNWHYPAEAGSTSSKTTTSFVIDFNYGGRYWITRGFLKG